MGKLLKFVKKGYQKHLERSAQKKLDRPDIYLIHDDLMCEATHSDPLHFGAIGAGKVFDRWMKDMLMIPDELNISVKGLYDSSAELMHKKSAEYGIPVCYDSYESMLSDPQIDAIYVATPNFLHAPNTIQALQAGKHVLCEKPIALNCTELDQMYRAAESHGVFLMEGMWMLTIPLMRLLSQLLTEGIIGDIRYLQADCCNNDSPTDYPALFSKEKGGGALMDVGCYALHIAHIAFAGQPAISSAAALADSGIDLTSAIVLKYNSGIAVLAQSLGCVGGAHCAIHGTKGWIQIPRYLDSPSEFTVHASNGKRTVYRYPVPREQRPIGYAYEILAFADSIRSGRLSCPLIPKESTKNVAMEMEQIRRECGVYFAGENHDSN